MKQYITKTIKSLISLIMVFIFNLPTLAAFDVNYSNLAKIPDVAHRTDVASRTGMP